LIVNIVFLIIDRALLKVWREPGLSAYWLNPVEAAPSCYEEHFIGKSENPIGIPDRVL